MSLINNDIDIVFTTLSLLTAVYDIFVVDWFFPYALPYVLM